MKRITCFALAAVLALSLTACGSSDTPGGESGDSGEGGSLIGAIGSVFAPKDISCVSLSLGVSNIRPISVATMALDAKGTLYTWGSNNHYCIGDGDTDVWKTVDVPTPIMENVAAVSMGGEMCAALKTDGSLWTWGVNDAELHEDGSYGRYQTPTPEKVMDNVKAVSCGNGFAAAIKDDNSLWMFGENDAGQIGNGEYGRDLYVSEPVKVLDDVIAVSCGVSCVGAVRSDGTLWMWGRFSANYSKVWDDAISPVQVMEDVAAVSCGYGVVGVIKTDGSLWMWGAAVGNEEKIMEDVKQVSAGSYAAAILQNDGSLWMYPFDRDSDGTPILDHVAYVSYGTEGTGAIKEDGTLWMWGYNNQGQLGIGSHGEDEYSPVPVQVMDNMMVP